MRESSWWHGDSCAVGAPWQSIPSSRWDIMVYSEVTPNMSIFFSPDGTEHLKAAEVHLGWDFQRCSKDRGVRESGLQWHLLDNLGSNIFQVSLPALGSKRGCCEKGGGEGRIVWGWSHNSSDHRFQPTNLDKLLSHRYSHICNSHIYPDDLRANEPVVFPAAFRAMAMLNACSTTTNRAAISGAGKWIKNNCKQSVSVSPGLISLLTARHNRSCIMLEQCLIVTVNWHKTGANTKC